MGDEESGEKLSHVTAGGEAQMVDVGGKNETERVARARGRVRVSGRTLELLRDNALAKGDALAVARIAGIQAAKETSRLVPLCHPLPLTHVEVGISLDYGSSAVEISAVCRTVGRTGVEMEALMAVSVAALTLYDMAKSVDKSMIIDAIRLVEKSGGRSGHLARDPLAEREQEVAG
jgi:cyclic pyranopterin phosphate synthase